MSAQCGQLIVRVNRGEIMPAAIRRIHSKYLGEKAFPKEITEFEIREFFTLSAEDLRAIRVDSNKKSRLALALQVGFLRMTGAVLDTYDYIPRAVLECRGAAQRASPDVGNDARIVAPSHDSASPSELGLSIPGDISTEGCR